MPGFFDEPARLTSSLNEAINDTGRIAFCGPVVLQRHHRLLGQQGGRRNPRASAISLRGTRWQRPVVKGTHAEEVAAALAHFGYGMQLKESYIDSPARSGRRCGAGCRSRATPGSHYILAIHKGKEGHWVLIKGVKLCDTYSEGRWQFVCDGPHQRRAHHGGVRGEKGARVLTAGAGPSKHLRGAGRLPTGAATSGGSGFSFSAWDRASRARNRRTG